MGSIQGSAKRILVRQGISLLRCYFRYVPLAFGKQYIWRRVYEPYFAWRKHESSTRTRFGAKMVVRLPDAIQSTIFMFGVWEPQITSYIRGTLQRGDTFIDAGANVGYYSLLASMLVGNEGLVIAIEASPSIFDHLNENLRANDVRNTLALNFAVHRESAQVEMFREESGNLGGSTIMAELGKKRQCVSEGFVPARPLGEIIPFETLTSARLIKIDVEGAEGLVIEGIREFLARFSPRTEWILELSPGGLETGQHCPSETVFETFIAHGYQAYLLPNEYGVETYLRAEQAEVISVTKCPKTLCDILFSRSPLSKIARDLSGNSCAQ